MGEINFDIFVL